MKQFKFVFPLLLIFVFASPAYGQIKDLLTPQESLWLASRNNTIIVFPEQNNPPYSYQSASGTPQGLSIDYLELIAERIGVKIEYASPRPLSQILVDIQNGKGDVVATATPDTDKDAQLFFTEPYIKVPAVIVVRKDMGSKTGLTLNDFSGKRIAVIDGSALESYVHTNYPRIVIEEVTDDEVGLQQVVLGETDAAVMDVASLSYYLSKQVLSSVKIVGSTTFEYRPAFGVPKDEEILQSILEKGLSQVSESDRALLTDKWIVVPGEQKAGTSLWVRVQNNLGVMALVILSMFGIVGIVRFFTRRRFVPRYVRRSHVIHELKDEVLELEDASKSLVEELEDIKNREKDIKSKIEEME